MAERRDWQRASQRHNRYVVKRTIKPNGEEEVTYGKHSYAANGGAGRGQAARDKRASRKRRQIRARSSKRA